MAAHLNSRPAATRRMLLSAFYELLQERRLAAIRVADIAARGGVSRSTFYEYFDGKDDILVASMFGPFAVLADPADPAAPPARLQAGLEHFWGNRRLARQVLDGKPRQRAARRLAELIGERLAGRTGEGKLPPRLLALGLAEGELAMVHAWLIGDASCSAEALARGLRDFVRVTIESALQGQGPKPPSPGERRGDR